MNILGPVNELPRVPVKINNKTEVNALIDSGASRNFAKPQLASREVQRSSLTEAVLADGQTKIRIIGVTIIDIEIAGITTAVQCHLIDDLRDALVLGQQWLIETEAVLDFKRQCLHFGRKKRTTAFFCRNREVRAKLQKPELPPLTHGFPEEYLADFNRLTEDFSEIFQLSNCVATARSTSHRVRVKKENSFQVRPYRYSETKKRVINEQVEEMLAAGVIEPSTSSYSSPIVIVNKKDGSPRFCVDYRRLNAITEDDATPLPLIEETIRDLGSATIFSSIDLKSGYWQVPLDPDSKHFTAFSTPDGSLYQFKVMPFGLKGSPATFQRLMTQEVLPGYIHDFTMVYLDDVVVYSRTWDEHLHHLRLVFERLQQHGLHCAPEKCQFGKQEIQYLGHIIGPDGNRPQQHHLQQIQDAEAPKNRRQLRKFLGLCNWLRDYVDHFADIATPLTNLLANKKWKWSSTEEEALKALKSALATCKPLSRPDPTLPFVLQTDASSIGIAAVLYQHGSDGARKIISYASARLTEAERRYHINEQECLAIVWAVKRYRPYLEDRPFTLRTDNRSLVWLQKTRDTKAKIARWAMLLQEFNFNIEHCPGTRNELPDLLSRAPDDIQHDAINEEVMLPPQTAHDAPSTLDETVLCAFNVRTLYDEVREAQLHDRSCRRLVERWLRLQGTEPQGWQRAYLQHYAVEDDLLFRRGDQGNRLVVPLALKNRVFHEFHDASLAGHPGAEETARDIQEQYYWPTVQADTRKYVGDCLLCARYKRRPRHPTAQQRPRQPRKPWDTVSVDLMGPYDATAHGHRFILVAEDIFTKWVEAFPVPNTEAPTITEILERQVFHRFGYPRAIITDNGPQFTCRHWDRCCQQWQTLHWTTAIFHPRANPVERRNQEIKKGLRLRLNNRRPETWDEHLPNVLFSLRRRRNAATGKTPSQALLGYTTPAPGTWRNDGAPQALDEAAREAQHEEIQQNQQRYQEARAAPARGRPPPPYQPGDEVLVRGHLPGNFAPKWAGPYPIINASGQSTYWVRIGRRQVNIHIDQIRPAPTHRAPPAGH